MQEKLKGMLRRWAEGDFKGDPQLSLIPGLYHQLKKEGIDFSSSSGSTEVSIILIVANIEQACFLLQGSFQNLPRRASAIF